VVQGVGEYLPFKNETFHFVLIVVTLCFASNPQRILAEAKRVLKKSGELILAIIDRNSSWGKYYSARAGQSVFYRTARFLTPEEVLPSFSALGMEYAGAYQTLIQPPPVIHRVENPQKGYGTGGFVVFKAKNSARR
jgi:ubiquinone/menaquinone biosynthesis C-methylase UbiE